jgi:hypothetical protein
VIQRVSQILKIMRGYKYIDLQQHRFFFHVPRCHWLTARKVFSCIKAALRVASRELAGDRRRRPAASGEVVLMVARRADRSRREHISADKPTTGMLHPAVTTFV